MYTFFLCILTIIAAILNAPLKLGTPKERAPELARDWEVLELGTPRERVLTDVWSARRRSLPETGRSCSWELPERRSLQTCGLLDAGACQRLGEGGSYQWPGLARGQELPNVKKFQRPRDCKGFLIQLTFSIY
ncbi:hypothetical protein J6590_007888 [Homalodisca vitripennis]|nr:hypothetical protein J6590_007888 [Homalodisca vitripennis]